MLFGISLFPTKGWLSNYLDKNNKWIQFQNPVSALQVWNYPYNDIQWTKIQGFPGTNNCFPDM